MLFIDTVLNPLQEVKMCTVVKEISCLDKNRQIAQLTDLIFAKIYCRAYIRKCIAKSHISFGIKYIFFTAFTIRDAL